LRVREPFQTAFISCAFLVCQHRHENRVWMDSGALDVVCVGDAVTYGGDRGGHDGLCDDANFCRAEFA